MKQVLRWLGIAVVVMVILLIVSFGIFYGLSNAKLNRTYTIEVTAPPVSTDVETVARGEYLAITRGCMDCHGENLGGAVIMDSAVMATLYAPNLTPGKGGTSNYTLEDWVRAIQYGVGPDGRGLLIMPSEDYYYFGEADMGALLAYLTQLSAIDNPTPPRSFGPVGRMLVLNDSLPLKPETINHTAPRPKAPPPGITVEYGEYLSKMCMGCHGEGFSGGPIPGADPSWPPARNLTPHETGLATWDEADFITALREKTRPDGTAIGEEMPVSMGLMTDDELQALWLYFESLPPKAAGNR